MKNILFILTVLIALVVPTVTTAQVLRGAEPLPVEDSKPKSTQLLAKAMMPPTPLAFHTYAKVFIGGFQSPEELQRDLDAWFKDEGAKVEVTHAAQSQGTIGARAYVILTVFYKTTTKK